LILASGSPRRQQLLREAGLDFRVVTRPVEEIVPEQMSPMAVAEHLALFKARAYDDLAEDNVVITADTVVSLGNEILGKPAHVRDAVQMLKDLSGEVNWVVSGVCISHRGQKKLFHEVTKVYFRKLQRWEIAYYIERYQPFDKAGAYGIQEWIGMIGVDRIEGDFYNVVGLPVSRLWHELREWMLW